MKLIDVIRDLDNIEEGLIIYQQNQNDCNSDVILAYGEEGDNSVKEQSGKEYYYLIEVFLAKEFLEDWKTTVSHPFNLAEGAKRLYEYAINDA